MSKKNPGMRLVMTKDGIRLRHTPPPHRAEDNWTLIKRIPGGDGVIANLPEPMKSEALRLWHFRIVRYGERYGHPPSNPIRGILAATAVRDAKRHYFGFDYKHFYQFRGGCKLYAMREKTPTGQPVCLVGKGNLPSAQRKRLEKKGINTPNSANLGTW